MCYLLNYSLIFRYSIIFIIISFKLVLFFFSLMGFWDFGCEYVCLLIIKGFKDSVIRFKSNRFIMCKILDFILNIFLLYIYLNI